MLKEIKNKLSMLDTAFFVIDGEPYALSLRQGQQGNCDDIHELAPLINRKYYTPMMTLALKENWDNKDEHNMAQYGNHIFLSLMEYNCTPEKTLRILEGFSEYQLIQLANQLDVYFRIRPFYCKYKVRETPAVIL